MSRVARLAVPLLLVVSRLPAANLEPPMWVHSQSPLQSLHLGLLPAVPGELDPGEVSVQRSETWTNVWIDQRPELLVDYEAIDSRLGINAGLPRSMQFQIALEDRIGTGGRLDPLIESFHKVIGNHDARHTVERDSINIEVRDPRTGALLVSRRSLGQFSRGVDLTPAKRYAAGRGEASGAVSVRVPRQGSEAFAPAGMDSAISLAWSGLIRGRSVHAGAGLSRFASTYVGPVRARRAGRTLFIAAAQPASPRTAFIAQYLYNASVTETGPLASGSHEVTVGARLHLTPATAIDAGIVENVINFKNGPDFGFHFGLTRQIKRTRNTVHSER
ncbi:MAG TPA: DUF3187 family protein [Thermoanaerobaculia bacterium]|nr:DUF3187 family protein [Thermoanaerobaculia bacterium]